jgi:hypothetical protein
MSGIEMKGFEDLKRDIERFSKIVQDEVIKAAEDAAAQVVKSAVEAVAPRDTGQLASSVKVFENQDRKALTGQTRRWLLIGPEKKKNFYGFFLQKGWIWSKGRRKRAATGNTHSQSGPTTGSHRIPQHKWFPDPAQVEARAFEGGGPHSKRQSNQIQDNSYSLKITWLRLIRRFHFDNILPCFWGSNCKNGLLSALMDTTKDERNMIL